MRIELEINIPDLGNRLRIARRSAHLTQRKAAEKAKVTPKTINHLETNLRGVKYSLLCRLCELYGTKPGEILGIPIIDELSEVLK